jgi:hypothetical protein
VYNIGQTDIRCVLFRHLAFASKVKMSKVKMSSMLPIIFCHGIYVIICQIRQENFESRRQRQNVQ